MNREQFKTWALGRGYTPDGATSGCGNWAKGRGDALGKGDTRYILAVNTFAKEVRPMGRFTKWQKVSVRKYAEMHIDADGKLARAI